MVEIRTCQAKVDANQNNFHVCTANVCAGDNLSSVTRIDENLGISTYF